MNLGDLFYKIKRWGFLVEYSSSNEWKFFVSTQKERNIVIASVEWVDTEGCILTKYPTHFLGRTQKNAEEDFKIIKDFFPKYKEIKIPSNSMFVKAYGFDDGYFKDPYLLYIKQKEGKKALEIVPETTRKKVIQTWSLEDLLGLGKIYVKMKKEPRFQSESGERVYIMDMLTIYRIIINNLLKIP